MAPACDPCSALQSDWSSASNDPQLWYRRVQAAGVVGASMTSGLNMHQARHSFATDLRRVADLGAASQALGHSDLSTTAAIYGHYDLSDLERAMDALARARREREEPAD